MELMYYSDDLLEPEERCNEELMYSTDCNNLDHSIYLSASDSLYLSPSSSNISPSSSSYISHSSLTSYTSMEKTDNNNSSQCKYNTPLFSSVNSVPFVSNKQEKISDSKNSNKICKLDECCEFLPKNSKKEYCCEKHKKRQHKIQQNIIHPNMDKVIMKRDFCKSNSFCNVVKKLLKTGKKKGSLKNKKKY
jgi:hypothetical protein